MEYYKTLPRVIDKNENVTLHSGSTLLQYRSVFMLHLYDLLGGFYDEMKNFDNMEKVSKDAYIFHYAKKMYDLFLVKNND